MGILSLREGTGFNSRCKPVFKKTLLFAAKLGLSNVFFSSILDLSCLKKYLSILLVVCKDLSILLPAVVEADPELTLNFNSGSTTKSQIRLAPVYQHWIFYFHISFCKSTALV